MAIDDIKKAAIPVLRHRVSANFQAQAEGKTSDDIVVELLKIVSETGAEKVRGEEEVGDSPQRHKGAQSKKLNSVFLVFLCVDLSAFVVRCLYVVSRVRSV